VAFSAAGVGTALIKAGAIRPVVGGGCAYFCLSAVQTADTIPPDNELFYVPFLLSIVLAVYAVWAIGSWLFSAHSLANTRAHQRS